MVVILVMALRNRKRSRVSMGRLVILVKQNGCRYRVGSAASETELRLSHGGIGVCCDERRLIIRRVLGDECKQRWSS